MKKRISLLAFTLALFMSQSTVWARESENTHTVSSYVNLFLEEIQGTKNEESVSSLKESINHLMESIKPEDAKEILAFVEEKIEEGKWDSKEGIEEAIGEGEEKFDAKLTEEQKELIITIAEKIKKLGIDPKTLVKQAEKIYEKYSKDLQQEIEKNGQKIVEDTQSKIKEEINNSLTDYFSDMINSVKSFFKGIFKK